MTTRVVISMATGGRWQKIADVTWPAMRRYSQSIGAIWCGYMAGWPTSRPEPWRKLCCIADTLAYADEVLWLDADVVVCGEPPNIFEEFDPECDQAMVMHPNPEHHNTGVWLLRRSMLPHLVSAAMQDEFVHHRWWEQAAIHRVMESMSIPTQTLPERWNCWSGSPADIEPCFRHACGMPDQFAAVTEWASR